MKGEIEMTEAYPVFIKQHGKDFLVYVPDWDIYTEGRSFADAIAMARDAIGLKGMDYQENQETFPEVSTPEQAIRLAVAEADEDFDFQDGTLTFVDVDFTAYLSKLRNRAVKKNCTIPYWLNEKAEQMGINFSQTLQEALMAKVN